MTPEQLAALVYARVARALIRMASMQAANTERVERGYSIAYNEGAFLDVIEDEGLGENAVLLTLRGEQP